MFELQIEFTRNAAQRIRIRSASIELGGNTTTKQSVFMNYTRLSLFFSYAELRVQLRNRSRRPRNAVLHLELHATSPFPSERLPIASLARIEREQAALALRTAHRRALHVVLVVGMEVVAHTGFIAADGTQRTGRWGIDGHVLLHGEHCVKRGERKLRPHFVEVSRW